jgi:hypothetical protein
MQHLVNALSVSVLLGSGEHPVEIRSAPSVAIFKRHLKTHFISPTPSRPSTFSTYLLLTLPARSDLWFHPRLCATYIIVKIWFFLGFLKKHWGRTSTHPFHYPLISFLPSLPLLASSSPSVNISSDWSSELAGIMKLRLYGIPSIWL